MDAPASAPTVNSSRRTPPASIFGDLMRQVRAAGLLERRYGYYAAKIAVTAGLFAAAWVAFIIIGDSWWQLLTAGALAIVFTHLGFIGHDAGHRQIFRSRQSNEVVGLLHGNLAIGLSYGWWVDKHNRHHAHPNQEDKDPDIVIGALAFTPGQARDKRGLTRLIARHQRYFFLPLLMLEAVQLHVSSVQALFGRSVRHRGWEAGLLLAHFAAYFVLVFAILSPIKAVLFIVVHQALFGLYLGLSFAPNHKGMPMLSADDESDFLRRLVLTARNVRPGWSAAFALGGL